LFIAATAFNINQGVALTPTTTTAVRSRDCPGFDQVVTWANTMLEHGRRRNRLRYNRAAGRTISDSGDGTLVIETA
jgi:hypothetical protein